MDFFKYLDIDCPVAPGDDIATAASLAHWAWLNRPEDWCSPDWDLLLSERLRDDPRSADEYHLVCPVADPEHPLEVVREGTVVAVLVVGKGEKRRCVGKAIDYGTEARANRGFAETVEREELAEGKRLQEILAAEAQEGIDADDGV